MKVLVVGINLTGGIGRESGKPFQFAPKAWVCSRLETVGAVGDKFWRKGAGFEPMEVECTEEGYNALLALKDKLPAVLELETQAKKNKDGAVLMVVSGLIAKAA